MKLNKLNAAAFVTVANSMQHYARAARDYFANPTQERKEVALRKGQLFYGHLRKLEGEPRYLWCLSHPTGVPYGSVHPHIASVEKHIAELRELHPGQFDNTGIAKLRVLP
jgi:hypothetical protein